MDREALWTCRDGSEIAICEMTDEHIANTKRMLERRLPQMEESLDASWGMMLQGEMAEYYLEQDRGHLEEEISETHAWIRGFEAELSKRANA